jgi:outer membrane protein OmpA-like peptidoglycan-associated protein
MNHNFRRGGPRIETPRVRRAAAAFVGGLSSVLVLLGVGAALAEPPPTLVDTQRIIQSLQPSSSADARSLRVVPRRVTLDIRFANDSDRLTAAARSQLTELGTALASPQLADARFLIAGHTTATGAPEHNQRLSEARARAVRTYLLEHFHIAPARLETIGFGAARPLPDFPPNALEQRRVELSTLPPAS